MEEEILLQTEDKMQKAVENVEKRFTTVRAGRANPSSLDGVMVSYYGVDTPLKQLATISVPEARQLLIKPFHRSCLGTNTSCFHILLYKQRVEDRPVLKMRFFLYL